MPPRKEQTASPSDDQAPRSGCLPPARPRARPAFLPRGAGFFLQPLPSRYRRNGLLALLASPAVQAPQREPVGPGPGRVPRSVARGLAYALLPSSRSRLRRSPFTPKACFAPGVCAVSAAARVAAALSARAEEVCRRYLPQGRKQGRYWTAGDVYGARGRSLFVRLAPPGTPGKFLDAATGEHGDLLDLIRIASGAGSLRAALAEARAFLAMPPMPAAEAPDDYDRAQAARRLWQRCRAIDGTHAEAYLEARGIQRCRLHASVFAALRFHPALIHRDDGGVRRLPALVAAVTADAREHLGPKDHLGPGEHPGPAERSGPGERLGHGAVCGVLRTWLDPHQPAKANVIRPRKALGRVHGRAVRFGALGAGTLLVGEGIETVLSIVTAIPDTVAAAALSAGSLSAFVPPAGVTRLVIARDNDPEGERAAERLVRRCARAGVAALVVAPEGEDFNSDLVDFGAPALRARLAPVFRPPVGAGERW